MNLSARLISVYDYLDLEIFYLNSLPCVNPYSGEGPMRTCAEHHAAPSQHAVPCLTDANRRAWLIPQARSQLPVSPTPPRRCATRRRPPRTEGGSRCLIKMLMYFNISKLLYMCPL